VNTCKLINEKGNRKYVDVLGKWFKARTTCT